jgi:hypothetical protein
MLLRMFREHWKDIPQVDNGYTQVSEPEEAGVGGWGGGSAYAPGALGRCMLARSHPTCMWTCNPRVSGHVRIHTRLAGCGRFNTMHHVTASQLMYTCYASVLLAKTDQRSRPSKASTGSNGPPSAAAAPPSSMRGGRRSITPTSGAPASGGGSAAHGSYGHSGNSWRTVPGLASVGAAAAPTTSAAEVDAAAGMEEDTNEEEEQQQQVSVNC